MGGDIAVAAAEKLLVQSGGVSRSDATADHPLGGAAEHVGQHQRPHLVAEMLRILPISRLPSGNGLALHVVVAVEGPELGAAVGILLGNCPRHSVQFCPAVPRVS